VDGTSIDQIIPIITNTKDFNELQKEGSITQRLGKAVKNWMNSPSRLDSKPSRSNPISPAEGERRKKINQDNGFQSSLDNGANFEGFIPSSGASHATDFAHLDGDIVSRMPSLREAWGEDLTVNSAYRDPNTNSKVGGAKKSQHMHGKAMDISTAGWDEEKKIKFIKTAREQGFQGIGIYNNAIHIDVGSKRAWGPNYHASSIPEWATAAL
jgi:uncharacterized protein YcbK (DUF882 family)